MNIFFNIIKYINNLINSVETFNKHINQYKLITKEPALPSYAYINWGLHLINIGKKDRGIEKLKQSAIMNNTNPEAYINLGIAYAQDEKFALALKNFKKAIKLDPTNGRAWGYLAGAYSELNENTLAKTAFEKSLDLDRTNPATYLNYGIFCIKNNQKENAKLLLQKAYLLDPTSTQPIMMWSMILIEQKEYKGALLKLKKVLLNEPFNTDALHLCGLCSLKIGLFQDCIEYCKKSSSIKPEKKENYILICESYLNLNDEINCLKSFEKYEQYSSNDWKYYNSWGIALSHFNKFEESIPKFYKSIELKQDEYIVHNALSYSLIKLNRYDEAKKEIEEVMILKPEFAYAHFNLAQIFMKTEQYQSAIDCYKKALSLDANLKKSYFNIAGAYHKLNDNKNAIKYWEKTLDYDKNNLDAYLNLAMTYFDEENNPKKSIRFIRSAYELDKKNPDVVFKYGLILMKTNDLYRAEEKLQDALKLDENLLSAKITLAECNLKLNRPQKALEILNSCEDQKNEDEDFLIIKAMTLLEIYKNDKQNEELKNTILQICDKIQTNFNQDNLVEEIKNYMINNNH